ncbi:MAG: phosphotransferase [Pseudomonadota bacterium]
MSAARADGIRAFLDAAGMPGATVAPLASDASPRRYLRVGDAPARVLMDAPVAANGRMDAFVAVTRWLRGQGLSAPEVVAEDLDAGLLLLEDLGDDLYARLLAGGGADETTLYAAAVDLLAELPPADPAAPPAGAAPYDGTAYLAEARLVTDWYVPGVAAPLPADAVAEFEALVAAALAPLMAEARVLVLRDYHAENLIWLPGRAGAARVGLLDYQDALAGHRAYDLVSLLEDARRDLAPGLAEAMVERFALQRGLDGEGRAALRRAYDTLGAQRNLKIVGIFARLALRDGKPRYLDLIPRVWRHLERDLEAPSLAGLRRFVRAHVPAPTPGALARLAASAGAGTIARTGGAPAGTLA